MGQNTNATRIAIKRLTRPPATVAVTCNPGLYQINTRPWLHQLGHAALLNRPATLDEVPDAPLEQIASQGLDWVWLLWRASEAASKSYRDAELWQSCTCKYTFCQMKEVGHGTEQAE